MKSFVVQVIGWGGFLTSKQLTLNTKDLTRDQHDKIKVGKNIFFKNPFGGWSLAKIIKLIN